MPLNRVRVAWSNFPGAPGVSTFLMGDGVVDVTPIKTFFSTIAPMVPGGTTFTVPSSGDSIDGATGQLTGSWSGTGGGVINSTGTAAAFSGATGAMIRWNTGVVLHGRRLTGRTYIVPARADQYDTNGSLSSAAVTLLQNAGQALIAAMPGNLYVSSREKKPSGGDPGHGGAASPIVSCLVPDVAVVMRSRRI